MNSHPNQACSAKGTPYLGALGAWALAFGCSVGWGAFVMPGNTFLPLAGPVGSAIGLGLGALVILIIAANYHFLMNRYPDAGGTYTYTKHCFGYDHGFLSAWFLILTYVAIIWANATALPLIARTLLGSTFQFGFHYVIAGYHVYMGELILAVGSLVLGALVCLRRTAAVRVQILMAVLLFAGIVICFVAGAAGTKVEAPFQPMFSDPRNPVNGIFTVFALAPWAYVGFESVAHSAGESRFSLRHSFLIMTLALVAAGLAYIFLNLLAVTALPEGTGNWVEYTQSLDGRQGLASQPTFFAAGSAMGSAGSTILGVAALCGIFTGLIGNYIALSRLLTSLAEDGMLPAFIGETNAHQVPKKAILCICFVSVLLPFFGRTAISWIVDVTTVGATIAYAFASASAWKAAKEQPGRLYRITGITGMILSLLFALEFLIPNIVSIKTLATESYLILAFWGILGFVVFRIILKRDEHRRLGRSTVAWIVLLGLIIFTSSVWMRQTTEASMEKTVTSIRTSLLEQQGNADAGILPSSGEARTAAYEDMTEGLRGVNSTLAVSMVIQIGLIIAALAILFDIYSHTQKREQKTEIEKAVAEDASRAKTSFLSNMSHEIRTPMNAIIGLDSIALRNPNLQPQTREHLEKIGASAKHLLGLINDILDMSRIESGRMVLKNEEFSFREFLDQINIMINGQCVDKGLHYDCDLIGRVRDYYIGDDMKLKQVLINILGNSVKFTSPPGRISLTVEETEERESECVLLFRMKDTGIGMEPSFIPRIFEAFSQEDAATINRYGGSGLGMAITKNFVEMMNGTIHVESEKGVGSVFTVTVTLGRSERSFRSESGISIPQGFRAAVVDDDEISREHARIVLESIGIHADVFTSAHLALENLHQAREQGRPYHLVLTDYKMPDMNGAELTRNLRTFDEGETIVFLLTGYNWGIIEEETLATGVDSIMAKPLFTDNLLKEISTVLARRSGVNETEANKPESPPDRSLLAGRRVLMAEDVEQNAEILEDLLDLEGIESEHAENGEIAVRMFSEMPEGYYDAILMDVRMPVMDGLTATKTIRSLSRPDARTVPIIAMTANVYDEDVERSLRSGMNAHLSKPIEPDLLYRRLAESIRNRQED